MCHGKALISILQYEYVISQSSLIRLDKDHIRSPEVKVSIGHCESQVGEGNVINYYHSPTFILRLIIEHSFAPNLHLKLIYLLCTAQTILNSTSASNKITFIIELLIWLHCTTSSKPNQAKLAKVGGLIRPVERREVWWLVEVAQAE